MATCYDNCWNYYDCDEPLIGEIDGRCDSFEDYRSRLGHGSTTHEFFANKRPCPNCGKSTHDHYVAKKEGV